MGRRAKYQTVEARKEAARLHSRLSRARKKATKEGQNIEAFQPEPTVYPHLEESALHINGPSSSLHVTSTTIHPNLHPHDISIPLTTSPLNTQPSSRYIDSVEQPAQFVVRPNLHPRDITKSLITPPLSMRLSSEYTDRIEQPAKSTIHPNLHPRNISETLKTSPLSMQLSSQYTDPIKQTAKVAATHVAQGELIGVEELTQAARRQSSDERKARKAARRRRYRARRKASRMKIRVGLLGVLQATIQRHLPAVLLRVGGTLSQSGTSIISNMSSWFPKL